MSDIYSTVLRNEVPGVPGYFAGNDGSIRGPRVILKPSRHSRTGYWTVSVCVNGRVTTRTVHSLVALAFYGERPVGHEVNHKDGNKGNNRPDNLEYVTKSRNRQHAFDTGIQISPVGERTRNHKLTDATVRELRQLAGSVSQRELAERFGVAQQTVSKAIRGDKWRHV